MSNIKVGHPTFHDELVKYGWKYSSSGLLDIDKVIPKTWGDSIIKGKDDNHTGEVYSYVRGNEKLELHDNGYYRHIDDKYEIGKGNLNVKKKVRFHSPFTKLGERRAEHEKRLEIDKSYL